MAPAEQVRFKQEALQLASAKLGPPHGQKSTLQPELVRHKHVAGASLELHWS